ncbi:phytoene/squalene synthase family protein [Xylella taiwanensis]|uniref:Phytoene synthase n=1 Tax=Xylella taiwanensis TaxID=1444770 RepID=Z9JJ86_9GAMM|nr:phytoene synthase [Xylella taiwanensis]AXI83186.1 phytoene synthase [Xylella taiwanensis]EWS77901.1 phytoene synthase [Xylella taiwanensis]MCD8456235.1 phytoene/squalene synthase family protein [Xylella taiwanensis]MCD8458643.1 phytoene/squalene synthase family protein [Xylella taiwanensis]MCD8460778.1 phytoene/squalene synthase family protein [Xylella taiwanensis]
MSRSSALDSFLDKWLDRWPEWSVAELFIPEPQRRLVMAWFTLLQEFEDVMNVAGDPLPADAKLAWWQQELIDWAAQRSRHPLGRLLEPVRAPWAVLADALPAVQVARRRPDSFEQALLPLQPLVEAVAAVEAVAFARIEGTDRRALALQWLDARHRAIGAAAAPAGVSIAAWRAQLLAAWPVKPTLVRPHRIWSRLMRLRLHRQVLGQHGNPSPLQQLWHSWRAASGGD